MRSYFNHQLEELRTSILRMGDMVDQELQMAMKALIQLDVEEAQKVMLFDKEVNHLRFELEKQCTVIISTQQPTAGDLRCILAVLSMIVDLERMGDQAKGIAKVVPHMLEYPSRPQPEEMLQMSRVVTQMLRDSMTAYAQENIILATSVAARDDQVDGLYARVFGKVMAHLAKTDEPNKVEATYEVLRAARELERYGDLATNVAERVIYIVTGTIEEKNVDNVEITQASGQADD